MQTPRNIAGSVLLLAMIASGGVFIASLFVPPDKHTSLPAEATKINDLCDNINLEMTEQEVDTLLAQYESSTASFERDEDNRGRPLIRTASHTKYYTKKGAIAGDYCIIVYLDDSYWKRVVGKAWCELLK